jgi:hypothetical protein
MSFIDLTAREVWSNIDIDNKVQALIRSKYSVMDEMKAARLSRQSECSADDLLFISSVDSWITECIQQGKEARIDNQKLIEMIQLEEAPSDDNQQSEEV